MVKFSHSPDQDRPGNKQYVVFFEQDRYQVKGDTHGLLSHAIKHYEEFDPDGMDAILGETLRFLLTFPDLFLMDISGNVLARGSAVHPKLTPNAVLNTFDLINDKAMLGTPLLPQEREIHDRFLEPLGAQYRTLIGRYIQDHVHIDQLSESQIAPHFAEGRKIRFEGIYEEREYSYILDTSNSGLLVMQGDLSVSTLFRIDKQGNDLGEIRAYFYRQVHIKHPELRIFLQPEDT